MTRLVHFEIHASEPGVLREYYEKLFGWTFSQWGDMPYWLVDTGPANEAGINGGLLERKGPPPEDSQPVGAFVCTVDVPDLDRYVARATELGGTVAVPKMPIEGVGWLAYAKDPDGNLFGMMQSDSDAA